MHPRIFSSAFLRYFPALMLILVLLRASAASGAETCYIEGNRVLLYKIINWWYDCLPQEAQMLCGLSLRCESVEDAQVHYREAESRLTLEISGGLAGQLALSAPCPDCPGSDCLPVRLRCDWINRAYFGRAEAGQVVLDSGAVTAFVFHRVGKGYHRRLAAAEQDIRFQVEGRIGGLMNGKIALYPNGDFIKTCPGTPAVTGEAFPVSLVILNGATNEEMARYTAVREHTP